MDREFLGDIYGLLQSIQAYPKGKVEDYDNVYLPKLSVKRVDDMAGKVKLLLKESITLK